MKILIVEDDKSLSRLVRSHLIGLGDVEICETGERAIEFVNANSVDIIILDLMLPGISGIEVLQHVRASCTMPIIVLSAISDTEKKVVCLKNGADDYIEKPFSREELIARVEANIRRATSNFVQNIYEFNNLRLMFQHKMLFIGEERVDVKRKTYDVLELLVRNKGYIMTKQQIFDKVWGYYSDTVQTVVETNIYRLRELLSQYGMENNVKTIKSLGYMWTENP